MRELVYTFSSLIIILSVAVAMPVSAAEITPDPDSYSYGSTSEFAVSEEITVAEDLAETGENTKLLYAVAGLLVILGVAAILYTLRGGKKIQIKK